MKIFLGLAKVLKLNSIPVERVEVDLNIVHPHGYFDNRDQIRKALHLTGSPNPPARDVFLVQQFLEFASENLTEGLLDEQEKNNKVRRSGLGSKKLMQCRDFVLVLRSILSSYGR